MIVDQQPFGRWSKGLANHWLSAPEERVPAPHSWVSIRAHTPMKRDCK